jgi:hypothetical protein
LQAEPLPLEPYLDVFGGLVVAGFCLSAAIRAGRHFASAALNWGVVASIRGRLELRVAPGCGSGTPFWRMQLLSCARAALIRVPVAGRAPAGGLAVLAVAGAADLLEEGLAAARVEAPGAGALVGEVLAGDFAAAVLGGCGELPEEPPHATSAVPERASVASVAQSRGLTGRELSLAAAVFAQGPGRRW